MKSIILLISILIPILSDCQQIPKTKNGGCITIETNGKLINDSINKPTFDKDGVYLENILKKHLSFTNDYNCEEDHFLNISFFIELDSNGKIIDSGIITLGELSDRLKKDFKNLVKEIDFWKPLALKEHSKISLNYIITFDIEIHKRTINLSLINEDFEEIDRFIIIRPI
jgi:hypothetical protein